MYDINTSFRLTPVRVMVQIPTSGEAGHAATVGFIGQVYQGFSAPCRPQICCSGNNGVQIPSGVDCLDQGLMTDKQYNDFQGMLNREF